MLSKAFFERIEKERVLFLNLDDSRLKFNYVLLKPAEVVDFFLALKISEADVASEILWLKKADEFQSHKAFSKLFYLSLLSAIQLTRHSVVLCL